jgi:hypothetical protein
MDLFDNLFDSIRPIAKSVNMGWYHDQLKEEFEKKRQEREIENSLKGCMIKILDENAPKDGQILLVQALTGIERKAFHAWAEEKNYKHCSIKTDQFEPNTLYYCKECKRTYYCEEMSIYLDWSTTFPGHCYGSTVKCRECNSYYDYDDPHSDINNRGEGFNAVFIGHIIPLLSKRETRKHARKRPIVKSDNDLNLLNKIGYREIIVMQIEDFGGVFEKKGRKYPRVRNFTENIEK